MRVLYIEDEIEIAEVVQIALTRAGYSVTIASEGREGLLLAQAEQWDVILLDVMLPGLTGMEICKRLRAEKNRTPILMLTARDSVEDQVQGLETGADDYLPKPFALELLLAHLRALIRRESLNRSRVITLYNLTIDMKAHTVMRAGQDISLTPRQWALFEFLLLHQGHTVTREMILSRAWDAEMTIASNSVEVYIKQLREKLETSGGEKIIHTVHGVGYVLRGEKTIP
jgi:DNA-binding response OmpR family regulator